MYILHFISPFIHLWTHRLPPLVIVNNAVMNMGIQTFFQVSAFSSFAVSYGHSV